MLAEFETQSLDLLTCSTRDRVRAPNFRCTSPELVGLGGLEHFRLQRFTTRALDNVQVSNYSLRSRVLVRSRHVSIFGFTLPRHHPYIHTL